jgi:hypothetical protein
MCPLYIDLGLIQKELGKANTVENGTGHNDALQDGISMRDV